MLSTALAQPAFLGFSLKKKRIQIRPLKLNAVAGKSERSGAFSKNASAGTESSKWDMPAGCNGNRQHVAVSVMEKLVQFAKIISQLCEGPFFDLSNGFRRNSIFLSY